MQRVYFAGKVSKDGWRDRLLGPRSMSRGEFSYRNAFTYVGPFAIGCDHGCFHSAKLHGLLGGNCCGSIGDVEYESDSLSPAEAVSRCLSQVASADLVVAYLDRDDCPGTTVELGYAISQGKPILVFHENTIVVDGEGSTDPSAKAKDELWFVKNAPGVRCIRGPVDMEQILNCLKSTV